MKVEEIERLRLLAQKGMVTTQEVLALCDELKEMHDKSKTFTIQALDDVTFVAGEFEFRQLPGRPAYLEIDGKKMDKFQVVEIRAEITNGVATKTITRVQFE